MRKSIVKIFSTLILSGFFIALISCESNTRIIFNIDINDLDLIVGEVYPFEYTLKNADESLVVVRSSAPEVVSVIGDTLVANSIGDATIYFEVLGTKISEKITVSVTDPDRVNITFHREEIKVLEEFLLPVVILNDLPVNYSSSNPDVLTIDDQGNVKALTAGTAEITVSLRDLPQYRQSITLNVVLDPMYVLSKLHVDKPLSRANVSSYGYNPDVRYQDVYGSVSRYFNTPLKIIESFQPITPNIYQGLTATPEILAAAEQMKLVRPGILLEEIKYITYHDTGNHGPTADAFGNLSYMKSADNANDRARSWHFTVDENSIYLGVPENEVTWQGDDYRAYAQSIGIETCVNYGSDLYATWQRTAKLIAYLLDKYDLTMEDIRQHYDWNQKECPQTLRRNNLYPEAMALVEAEYYVLTLLRDYTISFKSLNPQYVDNRGKVIKVPTKPTLVGYLVTITNEDGYSETQLFRSVITPTSGGDITTNITLLNLAATFDEKVLALPEKVTIADKAAVFGLVDTFNSYDPQLRELIVTAPLLNEKYQEILKLSVTDAMVTIYQVYGQNEEKAGLRYGYLQLYNPTDQIVDLSGLYIMIGADQQFRVDSLAEGIAWYQIPNGVTINPNGYLLIQGALNNPNGYFLPLADLVTELVIPVRDASIMITTDLIDPLGAEVEDYSFIIDLVGYGTALIAETKAASSPEEMALTRIYGFDTGQNHRDFGVVAPQPINSKNAKVNTTLNASQILAMEMDIAIKAFASKNLTIADYDQFQVIVSQYNALSQIVKTYVTCKGLMDQINNFFEGLQDPNLAIINQIIAQIPTQIVTDFNLPQYPGLTYRYHNDADPSSFDLATGTLLKTTYGAKYETIVLELADSSKEITINFGLLETGEKTIFISGYASAAAGYTYLGLATYNEQLNVTGFGGVAIIVNGKAFFIGTKAYIPLNAPTTGSTLSRAALRPLGAVDGINNLGLVHGVPSERSGTGALYQNVSDQPLSFDPTDTYGRADASSYGYSKVVFRADGDGNYEVVSHVNDTGGETTTKGLTVTLQPGDFLWCPHTFETNYSANAGTLLVAPGSSTVNGSNLPLGQKLRIVFYKTA